MSALSRFTQFIFGSTASAGRISQFGSLKAGTPTTYSGSTITPAEVQDQSGSSAGSNYLQGLDGALIANNSPAVQDINAMLNMITYQLAYLMQSGIPEYDSNTVYYTNQIVREGGTLYQSLMNSNAGNDPATNPSDWAVFSSATKTAVISASSGAYVGGSGVSPVTNLTVNIVTTGNPVQISLISDGTTGTGYFAVYLSSSTATQLGFRAILNVDSTNVYSQDFALDVNTTFTTTHGSLTSPTSAVNTVIPLAAGSHTISVYVEAFDSSIMAVDVLLTKLFVKELY